MDYTKDEIRGMAEDHWEQRDREAGPRFCQVCGEFILVDTEIGSTGFSVLTSCDCNIFIHTTTVASAFNSHQTRAKAEALDEIFKAMDQESILPVVVNGIRYEPGDDLPADVDF